MFFQDLKNNFVGLGKVLEFRTLIFDRQWNFNSPSNIVTVQSLFLGIKFSKIPQNSQIFEFLGILGFKKNLILKN